MIYVFLADGFEELEALSPVDVLRRAGVEVKTVGVTGKTVVGSHKIPVVCDTTAGEATFEGLDGIILPGGMPGTLNLENDTTVQEFINYSYKNGKIIGAICAAPSILGHKGLLKGKSAICYPSFEDELIGAQVSEKSVVCDGNIITAKSAGCALDFALAYLEVLEGSNQKSIKTAFDMRYDNY